MFSHLLHLPTAGHVHKSAATTTSNRSIYSQSQAHACVLAGLCEQRYWKCTELRDRGALQRTTTRSSLSPSHCMVPDPRMVSVTGGSDCKEVLRTLSACVKQVVRHGLRSKPEWLLMQALGA